MLSVAREMMAEPALMLVDEPTAAATLQAAWDAGVRYYDTAPYYGRGLSEIRYGRFLDAKPRSDFVLSSKVGRWFFPPARPDEFQTGPVWAGGLRFEHVHDYSYDGIMRSYEQSQMRLGMNRIDLLLIHDLEHFFLLARLDQRQKFLWNQSRMRPNTARTDPFCCETLPCWICCTPSSSRPIAVA